MFLLLASAWAEDPPSADEIDDFLAETSAPVAPPPPSLANALNPRLTAFGDALVSVAGDGGSIDPRSGPWLRSFEADIRADVDPYAKAVAVLAFEQEPPLEAEEAAGEEAHAAFAAVPEEVYVDFVGLPGGLGVRAGQFKLPFGITNKMHPHDYPWPTAPEAFVEALGEEGVSDIGALGSWRPSNPFGLGLTLQGAVLGGSTWDPHGETATPAWFGRAELFYDFGRVDVGVGASSFGLGADHVDGADLVLRYVPNTWRSVVLVGEAFRAGEQIGWTSTLQLQPARRLYLGGRLDGADAGLRYGGWLAFYTSEFLRIRAGATTDGQEWLADGQLTFVWGAHPVEPYWVNR